MSTLHHHNRNPHPPHLATEDRSKLKQWKKQRDQIQSTIELETLRRHTLDDEAARQCEDDEDDIDENKHRMNDNFSSDEEDDGVAIYGNKDAKFDDDEFGGDHHHHHQHDRKKQRVGSGAMTTRNINSKSKKAPTRFKPFNLSSSRPKKKKEALESCGAARSGAFCSCGVAV